MSSLCLLSFTHARPVRLHSSLSVQKKVVAPKLQNVRRTPVRRSERFRSAACDSDGAAEASTIEQAVVASEAQTDLSPAELLAELQATNRDLRSSLSHSLQELQAKHGETDQEAVSLLALSPQSLADLAEDIDWAAPEDEIPFWERSPRKADAGPLWVPPMSPAPKDERSLHVMHLTAEMAPLAKVGGLGDAVQGLAHACMRRGHHVEVVLPFYESISEEKIENLEFDREIFSFLKGQQVRAEVFTGKMGGVPMVLIRPDSHLFKGGRIYGGSYNELEAYLYFSRAALEYMLKSGRQPDIIHTHDWHTAATGMLYWDVYNPLGLWRPQLVMTIHNLDNTGEVRGEELAWVLPDAEKYLVEEKAMDPRTKGHNPERASLLKAGIVYSSKITTVSPTYAQDTLDGAAAGWLKECLAIHAQKFSGLINGIDSGMWDPQRDCFLPAPFSSASPDPKKLCKEYVLKGLGIPVEEGVPVVTCISRLVPQKGIHLIKRAIYRTAELGGIFILLGSAPDPGINHDFMNLRDEFVDDPKIKLLLMYSEPLAHQLYAAADIIVVPSMFEPCGLTQLVSMQYGTIPVVRRTGGLADTVFDVDEDGKEGNGFVFDGADEGSLDSALDRAIQCYKEKPEWWAQLSQSDMQLDNTWDSRAGAYVDLYQSVL